MPGDSSLLLHAVLATGAAADPNKLAVIHPGRAELTYAELAALSDRLCDRLRSLGVTEGDRVGLYLHKSVDAVVGIFGILKAGAAYVPVDPDAPPERCAYVLADCSVKAVICERDLAAAVEPELAALGAAPLLLLLDDAPTGPRLATLLGASAPAGANVPTIADSERLAYILYTSGSTGRPKGVMLSHRAALSFVDWCSDTFEPRPGDRFSSHAPFHFDLSIHDIYVPLKHGATLVLVDEGTGKEPLSLAALIAEQGITVWYSTPSILNVLAQYGKLQRHDFSALRLVLFAGEVFPVPQLRRLKESWHGMRYFNLYGPTETNVCTYYEIPAQISPDRKEPFPIGRTCEHLRSRVVEGDEDVAQGTEGELVIAGPGVMSGYWNLPDLNDRAFLVDGTGERWYRTGDIVIEDASGDYIFHGRRDRMVKRHGYRIELGEIEAALARHPAVAEVAVAGIASGGSAVRIQAFLTVRDTSVPSIIDLKQFCVSTLPRYMVPDGFTFLDAIPRTSTDKIDYRRLAGSAAPAQ